MILSHFYCLNALKSLSTAAKDCVGILTCVTKSMNLSLLKTSGIAQGTPLQSCQVLEQAGQSCGTTIPGSVQKVCRYTQHTQHLGTWFSGGLDSAGLMVGLSNLRGLFQLK